MLVMVSPYIDGSFALQQQKTNIESRMGTWVEGHSKRQEEGMVGRQHLAPPIKGAGREERVEVCSGRASGGRHTQSFRSKMKRLSAGEWCGEWHDARNMDGFEVWGLGCIVGGKLTPPQEKDMSAC